MRANYDSLWLDSVAVARAANLLKLPEHELRTQYRYNTLNQVTTQHSPDGGQTNMWYDRLGRLVLSRNAKQLAMSSNGNHYYSYTRYDSLGRIAEVGQLRDTLDQVIADTFTRNETLLSDWFTKLYNKREEVTGTVYDLPYDLGALAPNVVVAQQNLRNRVSYVSYYENPGASNAYDHRSYYSYDIHGNVDTLLQDYGASMNRPNLMNMNGHRFKKFVYEYDLISGKVNKVMYQPGWNDQWNHRYYYDAENRLTEVQTSPDGIVWEKEAKYEYYLHGPLARTILGQQQVQGIDYAYTLQGWLKGINSTGGTETHDIGADGKSGSLNQYVARDAIGLNLNYYSGDYKPINAGVNPFPAYRLGSPTYGLHDSAYRPLYNGNISSTFYYNKLLEYSSNGSGILYTYKYDQLNRILQQDAFAGFDRSNNHFNVTLNTFSNTFREEMSYDANGNIQTASRNGVFAPSGMDRLTYHYYPGTNQLSHVKDLVPDNAYGSNSYEVITDIDSQPDTNYRYDAIGNLVKDSSEKIKEIKWNVYGKITEIRREATTRVPYTNIKYGYDAQGNRISKVTIKSNGDMDYSWYVRDAQGNMITMYTSQDALGSNKDSLAKLGVAFADRPIYGSSRLGVNAWGGSVNDGPIDMYYQYQLPGQFNYLRGWRQYELTNHLGNVLSTISDKKLGLALNDTVAAYYEPEIKSANDYYPFGMLSRVAQGNYRYGFNGEEKDNEVKEEGNQIEFKYRIHDPRIGRFLSVDPVAGQYPGNSPYSFAHNKVNFGSELEGLEIIDGLLKYNEFLFNKTGLGDTWAAKMNKSLYNRFSLEGRYNQITTAAKAEYNQLKNSPGQYLVDKYTSADPTLGGLKRTKEALETIKRVGSGIAYGNTDAIAEGVEYGVGFYTGFKSINSKLSIKREPAPSIRATFKNQESWGSESLDIPPMKEQPWTAPTPTPPTPTTIVDLVGFRKEHILNRHKPGAGIAGKTEFPVGWSDQKIIEEVNKIANNPNIAVEVGRWNSPYKISTVDGIQIRVDFYPSNHPTYSGKVSTAYPINTTPNP